MFDNVLVMVLTNFSCAMLLIAVFFMIINALVTQGRVSKYEIIFRWMTLFCLGFTGLYGFVMHAYFPMLAAATIGWVDSPFQFEVAVADMAFGVLGIAAFRASIGFRTAAILGNVIWLWGDAVGHFYQIFNFNNFMPGNAGSWLWMDVLVPAILVICLYQLRKQSMRKVK